MEPNPTKLIHILQQAIKPVIALQWWWWW